MPQGELAASAGRFEDLRHLVAEVVHMEVPQAQIGGIAGPDDGSKDGSGSDYQRTAASGATEQDSVSRKPPESAHLLPRLLAAMQAQHSVWQRVKVAMLAHLSRRLRAQLADSRAAAAEAAGEAGEREAVAHRRLQDANRVRIGMSACTGCWSRALRYEIACTAQEMSLAARAAVQAEELVCAMPPIAVAGLG